MDCVFVRVDEELGRGRTGGVEKFFRLNGCDSSFADGRRWGWLLRESINGFVDEGIDRDGGSNSGGKVGGDGGG